MKPRSAGHLYVEWLLLPEAIDCSWPIPDCDQAHTSFIKMAAPLMGRNVTVGVSMAF